MEEVFWGMGRLVSPQHWCWGSEPPCAFWASSLSLTWEVSRDAGHRPVPDLLSQRLAGWGSAVQGFYRHAG